MKEVEQIKYQENEVYGYKDLAELRKELMVTSKQIKEAVAKINKKLAQINGCDDA